MARPSTVLFAGVIAATVVWSGGAPAAQGPPAARPPARPVIVPADRHDTSPALRHMPPLPPPSDAQRTPHPPLPIRGNPRLQAPRIDPALQTAAPTGSVSTAVSFDGIGNRNSVLPPDTVGDVGPNHYVQFVNLSYAVYDKVTGNPVLGPVDGRTLWQGFGGPCESRNDGDPIALYDELAGRWLLTQFALPNLFKGPYYQCIAVSKTGDPTGEYHRYQFSFAKMNDYPKFGVWPDGYYMTMNQFSAVGLQLRWSGQGVVAFDRARMLNGQSASMIYFDLYSMDPNLGGMLPSDLDGPPPPAGTPNYFMQVDDNAWNYSPDQLQIWKFSANWANAGASTFALHTTLPTAAFDSNMCGYARSCIPQPNTSVKLDALADRLMYRLQYRNFGGYETLVTNHTVDIDGSDRAGVRWYEIRNPGGAATIHQQGTYAVPGTDHAWMASAAMDAAGNIALGYSVSGPSVPPSIRFTARLASDPLGQMTQGDNDILQGSGSQTHSASRWGDYSMMSVDPMDGCTFWFTTEYYLSTSSAGWRTRIGSFKLPNCGGAPPPPPPSAPSGLTATAISSSTITLEWTDTSASETGFKVERCADAGCSSATEITETAANVTTYSDTGRTSGTAYWYRVRAFNAGGNSAYSNVASATTHTTIEPPPPSAMSVGALSGSGSAQGKQNWRATVTIIVVSGGSPVAGATVTGAWSNGFTGSASCTTDASGQCSVSTGNLRTNVPSVTYTVDSLSHASLTYDAAGNAQTTVTVNRP